MTNPNDAMQTLITTAFENVLRCTVLGTFGILVVLLIRRLGHRALSPQSRCWLWLPVLLLLVAPRLPDIGLAIQSKPVPQPTQRVVPAQDLPNTTKVETMGLPSRPTMEPQVADTSSLPPTATPLPKVFYWRWGLAIAWLLGVCGIALVWLVGYLRLKRRILRFSEPLPEEFRTLLEDCALTLGMARAPRLVVTGGVQSPALIGLLKPTIVVPPDVLDQLNRDELRMTLLHELGHVIRRDLWFHWASLAVQALHWFNPLVWFAGYQFRADREAACDAKVLKACGADSRRLYGSTLIKLQTALAADAWVPRTGMLGSLDLLKFRIREIGRMGSTSARLAVMALGLAMVVSTVLAFAAAQPKSAQQPLTANDPPKAIAQKPAPVGIVVTPDGKPAPGAEVWLFASKHVIAKTTTNASGGYVFTEPLIFDRPDAIGARTVYTVAAKLGGYGFAWENIRPTNAAKESIRLELEEECVYHGKLTDQKGKPLVGGRVWCVGAGLGKHHSRELCYFDSESSFLEARPNAEGIFTVRGLPPGDIGINAEGSESWTAYHWFENHDTIANPKEHRMYCGPGTTLRGRALDPSGKPVVKAQVNIVTQWQFLMERSVITDENGAFEFSHLYNTTAFFNPGEAPHVVSFRHPDLTALPKVVKLKPGLAGDLTFEAVPGTLVKGVMIDRESLKPIADAELDFMADLEGRLHYSKLEFYTDKEGHFSFRTLLPGRLRLKTMPLGYCFVEPDDSIAVQAKGSEEKIIFESPPMRSLVQLTIATDPPLAGCMIDLQYKKNLRAGAKASEDGRGQLVIREEDGSYRNGWQARPTDEKGRYTYRGVPSDGEFSLVATAADGSRVAYGTVKTNGDPEQSFTIGSFTKAVAPTFKLINEHDKPWRNTDIQLDLRLGDHRLTGFRHPETDKDGLCTVKGLPENAKLNFVLQLTNDWRFIRQEFQLPADLSQPIIVKIENTERVIIKDKSGTALEIASVDDVFDKTGKSYGKAAILRHLPDNMFVISRKTMPTRSGYEITLAVTTKDGRKLKAQGQNTSRNDDNLKLVAQ